MAVGATEIVKGFQVVKVQPQAASIPEGVVSMCGACGSLVMWGYETAHNANQHGSSLTIRNARGVHEANSP
jgi:hypothetical protein